MSERMILHDKTQMIRSCDTVLMSCHDKFSYWFIYVMRLSYLWYWCRKPQELCLG